MACLSSICIILHINFKNFPEYTAVSFVSALTFTFTFTSGRTAKAAQHWGRLFASTHFVTNFSTSAVEGWVRPCRKGTNRSLTCTEHTNALSIRMWQIPMNEMKSVIDKFSEKSFSLTRSKTLHFMSACRKKSQNTLSKRCPIAKDFTTCDKVWSMNTLYQDCIFSSGSENVTNSNR